MTVSYLLFLACMGAGVRGVADDAPYLHLAGYEVPVQFWTEGTFHPVGYLRSYPVSDVATLLPEGEQLALATLFRAAHYACRFKFKQSYFLQTDAPLYQLLKRQYPGVSALEGEAGHVIYLGKLAEWLEGSEAKAVNAARKP